MISKEKKAEIIAQYGRKAGDTGSPEVQIAILTERITELTAHLQVIKKSSSVSNHHQKSSSGMVILGIALEMLGQLVDSLGENRNLNLR